MAARTRRVPGSAFVPDWLDQSARFYKIIATGIGQPRLDTVGSSSASAKVAIRGKRRCVFCCKEIHPFASICPHCTSNLVPLQRLSDDRAALEERVAILEHSVAELQLAQSASVETSPSSIAAGVEAVPVSSRGINWPHMAENVFLGRADARRCRSHPSSLEPGVPEVPFDPHVSCRRRRSWLLGPMTWRS